MSKLGLIASILSVAGVLTFATITASAEDAPPPCVHKDFKTEMVKQACTKGGQPEAKTVTDETHAGAEALDQLDEGELTDVLDKLL